MKTDFSINVQVNLGVTPELVELVSAILMHKPATTKKEVALTTNQAQLETDPEEQQPLQQQEAAASQAPTTKRGRKKKDPEPSKEEAAATVETNEANADDGNSQQQEPEQTETKESTAKPLTEEDVRAAMHRTRQRIEGEDYKEHTDSETYQKYHKALTAQFKNIAALLGSDKPSALSEDKREQFIKQCDELKIMKDGTIGTDCPF